MKTKRKCPECATEMSTSTDNRRYDESGVPNVVLLGVETHRCPKCAEELVTIPRMGELHRVIAFAIAEQAARLSGAEIRFLRKYLGWSGVDFANNLGVGASTVSKWENEQEKMGTTAERWIRLAVMRLKPVDEYPTEKQAAVADGRAKRRRFTLRASSAGWRVEPETATA